MSAANAWTLLVLPVALVLAGSVVAVIVDGRARQRRYAIALAAAVKAEREREFAMLERAVFYIGDEPVHVACVTPRRDGRPACSACMAALSGVRRG